MRHYIHAFALSLTLCTSLIHTVTDPNWCGNKHKNLVILNDILKNDPHAQVPAFLGIPTGRVEEFLREHDAYIFDLYELFIEKKQAEKKYRITRLFSSIRKRFRKQRVNRWDASLAPEQILEEIQKRIKRKLTYTNFPFTQDELNFFDKLQQEGKFLMVRSTGVEDTAKMANAGANASIAYVAPTQNAVERAMGEVVASYFGMQSLKNRIDSGEKLSATNLVLPVLIQELVGETLGGAQDAQAIPVSGVAYTTNQNISSFNFPVTEINVAYGHGEGIVANKVATDRYYIVPSRAQKGTTSLYPVLYEKRERLVPYQTNNGFGLKAIKNDYSLAHKSALSQEQIHILYQTLKRIETAYKGAMDVEFVVVGNTIYIVQARPAMHKPAHPSYFDLDAATNFNFEQSPSYTIVSGTGAARIITNPQDILVTQTLDEADQMPNSGHVKAVIVGTWASSLSHAAVNFMSHGIPCIFVQNRGTVAQWLSKTSPQNPLIIDIQRGLIMHWQDTRRKAESFIKSGWFEHPIERALSLMLDDAPVLPTGISHIPKDPVIMNNMQTLKTTKGIAERKKILTDINNRVETIINLTEKRAITTHYDFGVQTKQALEEFKRVYRDVITEFFAVIDLRGNHFEFLFYHKILEALLYQIHEQQRILSAYTYTYFLNEIYEKQYLQKIIFHNKSTHAHELTYAQYCPENFSEKWIHAVLLADRLQEDSPEWIKNITFFFDFLHDLEKANQLSLWFATVFYEHMNQSEQSSSLPETVQNLILSVGREYTPQNKQFLAVITDIQDSIISLKSQMGKGFNATSQAEYRWNEVTKMLIDPLTSSFFVAAFNEAPAVLKIIACSLMKDCIDIVDGTIKETKTSTTLSMNERILLFKIMLDGFYTIFKTWIKEIMPETAIPYNSSWSLNSYCEKMQELYTSIMDQSTSSSMFQKSADFSVNAAMLGTQTAFERHFPSTAEDIFMLIHQNSLVAVAATITALFAEKPLEQMIYLPPVLNACREALEKNEDRQIIPIGIDYTATAITLSYNIPLNNHSGACQLIYNTITQECVCAIQFLGQARGRWAQIAFLASISPQLSGLTFGKELFFDEKAGIVEWSWNIEKTSVMPIILQYINYMCNELSFERDIDIEKLYPLYQGTSDREQAVQNILTRNSSPVAKQILGRMQS